MKCLAPWAPALILAIGLAAWYTFRSSYESRLRYQARLHHSADREVAFAEHPGPLSAPAFPDKPLPLKDRIGAPLTPEQGKQLLNELLDGLMSSETAVQGISDAAFENLQEKLAAFSPEQLAALICSISPNRSSIPRSQRDDRHEMLENSAAFGAGELLGRQTPATILAVFDGLNLRDHAFLDRLINKAVGEMAKADPGVAWSWLQRQPHLDEGTQAEARQTVLAAACGGDAFQWLKLAGACGRTGEVIYDGWRSALDSPRFRDAWLQELVGSRGRYAAKDIRNFTTLLHDTQGFEATRDLVDSHPSLPGRDSLILSIASSHLSGGGAAKADWLISRSSPEALAANTGELMKSWTAKDPVSAAAWLNAAPPDAAWRGHALKAFAMAIAPHDAEAARAFATRIPDAALKSETMRAIEPPKTADASGGASVN